MEYADRVDPVLGAAFDDIGIMLFSHGVDSVGLAPVERWRELAERGNGSLVGLDA